MKNISNIIIAILLLVISLEVIYLSSKEEKPKEEIKKIENIKEKNEKVNYGAEYDPNQIYFREVKNMYKEYKFNEFEKLKVKIQTLLNNKYENIILVDFISILNKENKEFEIKIKFLKDEKETEETKKVKIQGSEAIFLEEKIKGVE